MAGPQTIRPCDVSSPCIDPANPITNFSTEAPDPNVFLSVRFPFVDPNNPVGGDPGQNQPPHTWDADGCRSVCTSQLSQLDADLCAARQAALCVDGKSGQDIFINHRQQCEAFCPDGLLFTYVVAAGLFVGTTQAAADAQAAAFACDAVRAFMFCFGSITSEVCVGTAYSSTITPSHGTGPFSFVVFGGSLPNGLTANQVGNSLVISGTPTLGGNFTFTVKAVDAFGNFMQKVYAICVVDITPSTLADGIIGVSYTGQLFATGCANQTQSWQVVSGTLPPGLSLEESTGKITGTPTGPAGTIKFTVLFQDNAT